MSTLILKLKNTIICFIKALKMNFSEEKNTEINYIFFKALKFLKIDENIEEEEDLGQIFKYFLFSLFLFFFHTC